MRSIYSSLTHLEKQRKWSQTVKCESCGKFVSYKEMEEGKATLHYVPDNQFGPEELEWTCGKCNEKEDSRAQA